jgi:ABC-type polysaccharide/polyol phosphate transport system ATPase subunit
VTALVRAADAGKRYRKYHDAPMLISAALRWRSTTRVSEVWAVRHVDLEVEEGASYGVIGRNGSGKSTLLQMFAGVTAPTEGRVTVRGRVAPLLSVGVGFHPELTGRENIYVNGTILGLDRSHLDRKVDEIIDFSEIEDFIDTPVKFYSSGMLVRLGFAVAIQAEPDVLLLDEVLAVGDVAFQMKCFDRMAAVLQSGTTVILVSHNLNAIRQLCTETLVLHRGEVRFQGPTGDALEAYQRALDDDFAPDAVGESSGQLPPIRDVADLTGVEIVVDAGQAEIVAQVAVEQAWPSSALALLVSTRAGLPVYYECSPELGPLEPGRWTYRARLRTPLPPGEFTAAVTFRSLEPAGRFAGTRPLEFSSDGRASVAGVADLSVSAGGAVPPAG